MSNSKRNQAVYRLEYNEAQGNFHFEFPSKPKHEPNTFGWATIAEQVPDEDATRFTYILDNLKLALGVDNDFTTDEVKRLWYVFSNAHLDLQSLQDKAFDLDPSRFM